MVWREDIIKRDRFWSDLKERCCWTNRISSIRSEYANYGSNISIPTIWFANYGNPRNVLARFRVLFPLWRKSACRGRWLDDTRESQGRYWEKKFPGWVIGYEKDCMTGAKMIMEEHLNMPRSGVDMKLLCASQRWFQIFYPDNSSRTLTMLWALWRPCMTRGEYLYLSWAEPPCPFCTIILNRTSLYNRLLRQLDPSHDHLPHKMDVIMAWSEVGQEDDVFHVVISDPIYGEHLLYSHS